MSKGKPPATEPHSGSGAKQTIHTILAQFREEATSNRDLGDRFERLICRYLELDPICVERFSRVWMWNEFQRKGNIGDVGIAWEAEVWIAEDPDHMIHFNGERFLGPYPDVMPNQR